MNSSPALVSDSVIDAAAKTMSLALWASSPEPFWAESSFAPAPPQAARPRPQMTAAEPPRNCLLSIICLSFL